MSVRAYRLIEIKTEQTPTFNLWRNSDIVDHLYLYDRLDNDGGGLVTCAVSDIEDMLNDKDRGFEIDQEVEEALRKDIETEKANGNNYVEWLCY